MKKITLFSRYLILFLSIFFLILICNIVPVNALNTTSWYLNTENELAQVVYYGCTGSDVSTCTNRQDDITNENMQIDSAVEYQSSNIVEYKNVVQRSNIGYDATGHVWSLNVNQKLMVGYLYSVQVYACTSKNVDISYSWTTSDSSGSFSAPAYRSNWSGTLTADNNTRSVESGFYCKTYGSIISPSTTSRWLQLRTYSSSNTTTYGVAEGIFNVKVEELGIWNSSISSSISNSIQNSGLATASSVSEVQTSLNQVKTEVQGMETQQQQTNQKLDSVNNNLTDESSPTNNDVSGKANEWSSKNASTGPISGMVLMPITLLNAYTSGMNSSCSPYNLGNLMGTDLILPCINVSNYVGSTLWGVIDVLFSGFMIYAMGKKFVKIFNDFTNLRDNQVDELYGGGN